MSNNRYVVIAGSRSGHCCFDATVVDLLDFEAGAGGVCECFELDQAVVIAELYNSRCGGLTKVDIYIINHRPVSGEWG